MAAITKMTIITKIAIITIITIITIIMIITIITTITILTIITMITIITIIMIIMIITTKQLEMYLYCRRSRIDFCLSASNDNQSWQYFVSPEKVSVHIMMQKNHLYYSWNAKNWKLTQPELKPSPTRLSPSPPKLYPNSTSIYPNSDQIYPNSVPLPLHNTLLYQAVATNRIPQTSGTVIYGLEDRDATYWRILCR